MFEADMTPLEPTGRQHSAKRLLLQQDRVRIQAFRPDGIRGDTIFGSAYSGLPGKCSVLPIKPDQLALDLDPVGRQDADFIGGVGRLQRNRGAAAAEAL